jgi:hypothetical protein
MSNMSQNLTFIINYASAGVLTFIINYASAGVLTFIKEGYGPDSDYSLWMVRDTIFSNNYEQLMFSFHFL